MLDCRAESRHDEPIMSRKDQARRHTASNPSLLRNQPSGNSRDQTLASGSAKWQRVLNRILFGGLLLWTYLSLCFPLYDTDFWWHLKTGEWILQEGTVPQVDLYTFTEFRTPWIDLHWGFQLFITLLYRLGGANLVILTKAAVITAAVAVAWSAGGRNLPVWTKTAMWILPVICISGRGYERPEMLSQLFLAMWLWMARHVEERPNLVWWLPVLQLVWVNCHALFVLGLVVGACYLVDSVARDIAQGRWGLAQPVSNPPARTIIWAGLLVVAACLVNPYFEEGAIFPLTLFRKLSVDQEFYSKNIGEFHRPLDFLLMFGWRGMWSPYLLAEVGVWCLTAASFIVLFVRRKQWSVLRLMLFGGFSFLAWQQTRNTNIFSLVSSFIACENLADLRASQSLPATTRAELRGTWGMTAVVTGLIVAVVSGWWNEIGELNKPLGLGEARHWYIHGAALFAGREGFPHTAFVANNGQASVYIYHNAPERRVFMDGRLEVCSKTTFEQFNQIRGMMLAGVPDWPGIIQNYGGDVPAVILDNKTAVLEIRGMLATAGWRLVFSDPTAAVFLADVTADALKLPRINPCSSLAEELREVERRLELIKNNPSLSPDELRRRL
jgi:hypothetical protein